MSSDSYKNNIDLTNTIYVRKFTSLMINTLINNIKLKLNNKKFLKELKNSF